MQSPWGQLLCFLPNKPIYIQNFYNPSYSIGRGNGVDVDFKINSPECSKEHFNIYRDGNIPCIRDSSFNGTWINQKHLHKKMTPLSNNSEIEIRWDHFFIFHSCIEDDPIDLDSVTINNRFYIFQNHSFGQGTFAVVKLCIDILTGKRYACKIIEKNSLTSKSELGVAQIRQEISILKTIQHPGIVGIVDVVEDEEYVYIFLTRVSGGELFSYIIQHQGIKEHEAKFLFYQILRGVKYLHDRNIIHRDLKPENLLLESPTPFSRVIITDFGMAKMLKTSLERMETRCGTLDYIAPEILNPGDKGYSPKVDVWSLGVILYAMMSGSFPFEHRNIRNVSRWEVVFPSSDGWNFKSQEVKDLIRSMLNMNPEERPSIEQVFEHSWISCQNSTLKKLYAKVMIKSGIY